MGKLSEVLPGQRHPSSSVEPMETVYQLPEAGLKRMASQPRRPCKCSDDPAVYLRLIWGNMMARCYRQTHPNFSSYGAQGITVFEPWHDCETFSADILRLIGPRPAGLRADGRSVWELDRINSESGYFPGNVRWLEWPDNQRNKRRRKPSDTPRRPRRQRPSYADLDPNAASGLPPYVISNSSGLFLNSSYRAV